MTHMRTGLSKPQEFKGRMLSLLEKLLARNNV